MASSGKAVFGVDGTERVRSVVEGVLGGHSYSHPKTAEWSDAIGDGVLQCFAGLANYKLVVDVLLLSAATGGVRQHASCRWNDATDDVLSVSHVVGDVRAIVSVFALRG